jgi:hypothetical protein
MKDNVKYYGIGKSTYSFTNYQFNLYFGKKGFSIVLNSMRIRLFESLENGEFYYPYIPNKFFFGLSLNT